MGGAIRLRWRRAKSATVGSESADLQCSLCQARLRPPTQISFSIPNTGTSNAFALHHQSTSSSIPACSTADNNSASRLPLKIEQNKPTRVVKPVADDHEPKIAP